MLEFIKMFGLGMLYTILCPFIVVIFALYLIYVFFNYLALELISFFGFFFGYTFTVETELEKKLESVKEKQAEADAIVEGDFDNFFSQESVTEELKGSDEHE